MELLAIPVYENTVVKDIQSFKTFKQTKTDSQKHSDKNSQSTISLSATISQRQSVAHLKSIQLIHHRVAQRQWCRLYGVNASLGDRVVIRQVFRYFPRLFIG